MGRGSSKAGGNTGKNTAKAKQSGGLTSKNAQSMFNRIRNQYAADSWDALYAVRDLMNGAKVGTSFVLKRTDGFKEKYVKKSKDKWAVSMASPLQNFSDVKASMMSANASAGQVVVTIYDLQ